MSEFGPSHPDELVQSEELKEKSIIFETPGQIAVILAKKPLVPSSEGFNLTVTPEQSSKPYFDPEAKIQDSMPTFLTALATARSVFGDRNSKDEYNLYNQWVNVHLLPRFGGEKHLQIEVTGRNAAGKTWGQPIDYPKTDINYEQFPVVKQEVEMVSQLLPSQYQEILNEAQEVTLFDKPGTEGQFPPKSKTIFQYQNFEIMAPTENPHIEEGGLHFWIQANTDKKFEGVQSDVKNGLEQFILSSAVAKAIYQEFGRPIEIHFSGNWGLAMPDNPKENLSAHANLYAAPADTNRVDLPDRPGYQRPPMPEEIRQRARKALEERLPELVNQLAGRRVSEILGNSND